MLNILFMGTPDFAKVSLEKLYNNEYEIIAVVTNPDKPKGRGMKLIPSPVKEFALKNNLTVLQPEIIKNNTKFINQIKQLNPDIICVVAYGKILPKEILEIPKYGCINLHGSLLPKYRGAAPIQWAILNGDRTTGVTTIYMDEKMDAGDIILKQKVTIDGNETTGQLWDRLSIIGADLLLNTIKKIEDGTAKREKQSQDYTVAPMLNKEISRIDWKNKTSFQIKNLVRGLNPIMGAYSLYKNKKIKFWKVDDLEIEDFITNFPQYEENIFLIEPGCILVADSKTGLYIKSADGIIKALEIQGENAKKMNIDDFLRGNKLEIGEILN